MNSITLAFISAWCGSPWSSKTEADIPIITYSTKQIINFVSCCYLFPRLHRSSNVNTSTLWFCEWLGILVGVKDFISKNFILKIVHIFLFVIHFSVTEGNRNRNWSVLQKLKLKESNLFEGFWCAVFSTLIAETEIPWFGSALFGWKCQVALICRYHEAVLPRNMLCKAEELLVVR